MEPSAILERSAINPGGIILKRIITLLFAALLATTGLVTPGTATGATVYKTYEGTGDRVIRLNIDAVSLVRAKHTGEGNFAIWALNGAGKETELLVNTIGEYKGTTLLTATAKRHVRGLAVTGDGDWTITTKPLRKARVWRDATINGTGDNVLKVPVRKLTLKAVYRGEGNFAIWALNKNGRLLDLLVNEIGRYRGTTVMPIGTKYVTVNADSGKTWTLTKR